MELMRPHVRGERSARSYTQLLPVVTAGGHAVALGINQKYFTDKAHKNTQHPDQTLDEFTQPQVQNVPIKTK